MYRHDTVCILPVQATSESCHITQRDVDTAFASFTDISSISSYYVNLLNPSDEALKRSTRKANNTITSIQLDAVAINILVHLILKSVLLSDISLHVYMYNIFEQVIQGYLKEEYRICIQLGSSSRIFWVLSTGDIIWFLFCS